MSVTVDDDLCIKIGALGVNRSIEPRQHRPCRTRGVAAAMTLDHGEEPVKVWSSSWVESDKITIDRNDNRLQRNSKCVPMNI
jgi:hypothetical protein